MQKPKKITSEWLKKRGACDRAKEAFRQTFPKGLPLRAISPSTAHKYKSNDGFITDIDWLAKQLLTQENMCKYQAIIDKRNPLLVGSWNLLLRLLKEQNGRRR